MAAFPPENQPLWYVKHLVIFMAIWTCFDLIFKKCNNALIKSLLVASSYSAACCLLMKTTNQIIMPAAFIYFAIGVLLKHLGGLWRFAKIHSNAFLLISILLTIVAVALRVVYPEDPIVGVTAHNRLIRNFSNISSILFVWMAFEYLPTIVALENRMELPKYSFFVYLAHAPIIASGLVVTGQTEFFPLAILKVVILVAFLVGMGWLLRKVLPDFWNVIVGGRI